MALKDAAEGATGQIRFMITVSYLEIYNEELHDLLNPQATHPLKIREHPDMGIYAPWSRVRVCSRVARESF